MVSINPDNTKTIKLSKEEQQAVLESCPSVGFEIASRIANSIDGIVQLLDFEAYNLRAVIDKQISQINDDRTARILCRISNKLSPNPIIASLGEKLGDKQFNDLDEMNQAAREIQNKHNNTPDPEMAGLTPNQVFRLVNLPWDNQNFAIKFNEKLSLEDAEKSYFFKNVRTLLKVLIELENENTATDAGNLSRKVMKLLFEKIILRESEKGFFQEFNRSFNERNAYTIFETRTICEQAHLIRKRGRKFAVIKKNKPLLLEENAGKLYNLLFRTFFNTFNIGYRDGFPDLYCVQSTIPYSFFVINKMAEDYCSIQALTSKIFLPAVKKAIEKESTIEGAVTGITHTRIIEPLLSFGLIEVVRSSSKQVFNVEAVRKTELFEKFMNFSV